MKSKVFVLGIAGPSGSGKSTSVNKVAALLEDSDTMFYDDYRPNYDKLTEDLGELRKGNPITYPIKKRIIQPKKYIVIEEPTGRQRKGMKDKIDFLVYINIPLEISFARVLLRSLEQSEDNGINTFYETIGPQFEPRFSEKPTKLMHIMHWQLRMYLLEHREIYLRDHIINKKDADLVIDGMKSKEDIANEIARKLL
ncbi:MAG: uridine kinase family protein [Candidatus Heimdallarchaeota archaeon]